MNKKLKNIEQATCSECKNKFIRKTKRTPGGLPNGVRSFNCKTCSRLCSKKRNTRITSKKR